MADDAEANTLFTEGRALEKQEKFRRAAGRYMDARLMADSPVLHATSKQPRLRAPLPMNLLEAMALSTARSATDPRALCLCNLL